MSIIHLPVMLKGGKSMPSYVDYWSREEVSGKGIVYVNLREY